MTPNATLRGDGWFAFSRGDQWILKFKVGKRWPQHRIPRHVQNESHVRRYVRAFLTAEAAERVTQGVRADAAAGPDPIIHKGMSFRDLAELWTNGTLATTFPDSVRQKRSSCSDRARLNKYILPYVGNRTVSDFEGDRGLELAEGVRRKLPADLSKDSRRHVSQILNKLLNIAVYPVRILRANPLPRGWLPRGSLEKAKSYLYPSEDAQLMTHAGVSLLNRLFYGVLAREGLRASEARELRVNDVDLENGVVHLDQNKTDDPRSWPLSPGVLEALRRYLQRHRSGVKPDDLVFVDPAGRRPPGDGLARAFRRDLVAAGVKRPQLFTDTPERKRIRGHDLRATFVTVHLANGKTETWIADRTGHKSSQMIAKYRRLARTHAELNLGELTPLVDAIPELAGEAAGRPSKRKERRHLRLVEPFASDSNDGTGNGPSGNDGKSR